MGSIAWFLAGAALAVGYCAALAHNVRRYLDRPPAVGAALHGARWAVLIAAFIGLARAGRGALLPAVLGFALAHAVSCWAPRRRA